VAPERAKRFRHWLRDNLAPGPAVAFIRFWNRLVRSELRGWELVQEERAKGPVIFCHWHGDDLALLGPFAGQGLTMMVSRSRDGEFLARIMSRLGYRIVRGSTTRGGVGAMKSLVLAARQGRDLGLTVDGPRGPRTQVQPGVIALAKLTGAPIFPAGVWARRSWRFPGTWHQTYLPKPGSLVRIVFDRPVRVPAEAGKEELEAKRQELEAELHRLHDLAAGKTLG